MNQRLSTVTININTISNRPLLFDTNILLYLFGTNVVSSNQQWAVKAYSNFYSTCLKNKHPLFIDISVLSEFINRCLRMEYDVYKKANSTTLSFKDFRNSAEGVQASQDIDKIIKNQILKTFDIIGKLFSKNDIIAMKLINTDFNDALLVDVCQAHNCILVTNDADFTHSSIDIISANNKLLTYKQITV